MAESRIKDENFYIISGWMITRLGLKGVPLSVYAIIYGFTQDGENEFTGSLQYLCEFTGGTSKPTIIKALKDLVEAGYISKREEIINGVQFNRYKVVLPVVKNFNGGSKETLPGVVKKFNGGSKETLPNNEIDNKKDKENKKELYTLIIGRLNEKAGTNYKPSSKATQEYINGRLNDGYTLEDFYTVIEKKCAEWMGTKMEGYLRPQTLFTPANFENYLNAPPVKPGYNAAQGKQVGANGIAIDPTKNDLDGIF